VTPAELFGEAEALTHLETLLAALPAAAYACAPDGRLLHYNEAAADLWGRRPTLGQSAERYCGAHALLAPDGAALPAAHSWMARALRDDAAYRDQELIVVRPDGSRRTVSICVTPLHGADGRLVAATAVLVDITPHVNARHAAEEALRGSEESFRAFFESSVVGFVQVNAQGRFVRVNDRYCELTGYGRRELLEMGPFDLDHPDDRAADLELVKKTVADPSGSYEAVKRYVRKNGTVGWVHVAANYLRDELGRPTQSAGVALDVSERKLAEEALRQADRAKDDFLATLGHELRNPLAPLKNAVELLHQGEDSAWCRKVIERQVQQLARLIDDLLDVSRIARDKLELRRETLDVSDVVQRAVEATRPLLQSRGQRLIVTPASEPSFVIGDLVRLTQVLTNLLTNAAKFTESGGTIRLGAVREGEIVRISVADTGIGIAKDDLARVFDKYFQSSRRGDRAVGGLGIGLALVRRLVELHGGSVEARSDGLGKGSEFIVRLATVEQPRASEPQRLGALAAAPAARRRVLIVDDDVDSADSLGHLVTLLGHEAAVAYDGPSALERARVFAADLVLLDLSMPGLDGIEVCRRLRSSAASPGVRYVAMTGWGGAADRARTAAAGFDVHLVKPLDLDALARLLDGRPLADAAAMR
jgi:two-component system CheB/CheR fusion protein